MTIMLIITSGVLIIIGIFGAVVPFLPGLPLAFIGVLMLAYATHFNLISAPVLAALACLALLSLLVDYLSGVIGARWGKASIWGTVGAITGLVVALVAFGPLGLVLGPAVGVLVFEFIAKRDKNHALRAAKTTFASSLLGIAANGLLAITFIVILVVAIIF